MEERSAAEFEKAGAKQLHAPVHFGADPLPLVSRRQHRVIIWSIHGLSLWDIWKTSQDQTGGVGALAADPHDQRLCNPPGIGLRIAVGLLRTELSMIMIRNPDSSDSKKQQLLISVIT